MIKILSVVGARPNFMKVAPIAREFKKHREKAVHKIVHTGQHYDKKMSDTFLQELEIPHPDYFLNAGSASHAVQTAKIMVEFEKVLDEFQPELVIVVGDVNSTIACSLTAVKKGIKVAHVEGGLRSFDRKMPEEINRIATDSICDYCFITEESAIKNLTNEGFPPENIFFTGNTMIDSLLYASERLHSNTIVSDLGLARGEFSVITLHRPSNVDSKEKLSDLINAIKVIAHDYKIVFPMHPRTAKSLEIHGLMDSFNQNRNIYAIEPAGYLDFVSLMKSSAFVLTDSGGIQEETTVLGIPCFTLRDSTERPVTIEIGTNILVNPDYKSILENYMLFKSGKLKRGKIPPLWDGKASERILDVILNKLTF